VRGICQDNKKLALGSPCSGTQPFQMAGSSNRGRTRSTKSPKKVQKRKAAAAPETESVNFNNEDYNIRSPERTELLTKIKDAIDNAPVSPLLSGLAVSSPKRTACSL
jgi:hypothetical protein